MAEEKGTVREIAEELLIGHFHRHVFICVGDACCLEVGKQAAQAAWDALKNELKERNLSLSTGPTACFRTKVSCMRICKDGPILLVYPEGTWYSGMSADRIPRFVQEHLIEGKPIDEWIIARNPLPQSGDTERPV